MDADRELRFHKRVSVFEAALMALATICTAWCSYQASTWGGRSSGMRQQAETLERKAAVLRVEGHQRMSVYANLFVQALIAGHDHKEDLEKFFLTRLPPDVRAAYDKWMATNPLVNPSAPLHPFVPELYQSPDELTAKRMSAEAAQLMEQSNRDGNIARSYLSQTVLLACVLFFAGTSAKFDVLTIRRFVIGFGVALFLFAAGRVLTLPFAP